MNNRFIIHSRTIDGEEGVCREEYFFSTDHCQGVKGRGDGTYPEGFVPTTHYLPFSVVPRPELPSGRVETLEDLLLIFYSDAREIPNPDPTFQPKV